MEMVTLDSIYKYPKKLLNATSSKLRGTEDDQSRHQLSKSMFYQKQIQFRYQPNIICLREVFLHHFIRVYYEAF